MAKTVDLTRATMVFLEIIEFQSFISLFEVENDPAVLEETVDFVKVKMKSETEIDFYKERNG